MVTWNGFTQKHHNFLQSRETFLGFTLNSCSFNKTFTSECGTSVLLCCCCCCCCCFVLFCFVFSFRKTHRHFIRRQAPNRLFCGIFVSGINMDSLKYKTWILPWFHRFSFSLPFLFLLSLLTSTNFLLCNSHDPFQSLEWPGGYDIPARTRNAQELASFPHETDSYHNNMNTLFL